MIERNILILGSTGQLGSELTRLFCKAPEWIVHACSHRDIDVTDSTALAALIERLRPSVVINCVAYNHVEEAERNPASAFAINSGAVASLAAICKKTASLLVHFSTDYVFDGESHEPYSEQDRPSPLNIYGLSKLSGEEAIRILQPRHCIVRLCGLYGRDRSPRGKANFVDSILEKASAGSPIHVSADLRCTPTRASELASVVFRLVELDATGTFHATNSGSCTWFEFARAILNFRGLANNLVPIHSTPSAGAVKRPKFTVLQTTKVESLLGRPMAAWHSALADFIKEGV